MFSSLLAGVFIYAMSNRVTSEVWAFVTIFSIGAALVLVAIAESPFTVTLN